MTGPQRVKAGVREGGQFTAEVRTEPDLHLDDPSILAPRPGADPLNERVGGIGAAVREGALAHGPLRDRTRHAALDDWLERVRRHAAAERPGSARAEAFAQFAAGIEHGVSALWSNVAEVREEYVVDRLLREMGDRPLARHVSHEMRRHVMWEKRTSKESRAEYAAALESVHGPMRRGMAMAGIVLSGQEEFWGIGDDIERVVFGPSRAVDA